MSELPMTPMFLQSQKPESEPVRSYTSSEFVRDINTLEFGVDRAAKFDLEADEPIDPRAWSGDATQVAEAPAEAIAPTSRAQEVAEPLFYLTDAEKVQFIAKHTAGVEAMRQAA